MVKILLLETATEVCSVAIAAGGNVIASAERDGGFRHSELLTVLIGQVLQETGMEACGLDAVCVSSGPGSYTGLRIGVAAAKGICYALGIPLLAMDTLSSLASHVASSTDVNPFSGDKTILLCPMLDARRMEVYTALYDHAGHRVSEISARIIGENSFQEELSSRKILFFGNGAMKCKTTIVHPNARFIPSVYASARFMSCFAEQSYNKNSFVDVSYFEPHYLKDFIATVPKNKVF